MGSKRRKIIKQVAIGDGTDTIIYIEQEQVVKKVRSYYKNLAGFRCIADRPTEKNKRADVLAVQLNAGNVYMLRGG